MRFRLPALLALALVLAMPLQAGTTTAPAPTASTESPVDALVSRYVAWRGGDAFRRLQSLYSVADVEYAGLKGVIHDWRDRSGRNRNTFDTPIFKQLSVHNREGGWVKDDGLVSQISKLEDQDARRANSLEFADTLHDGAGRQVQRLPDETVDGRKLAVLRVTFGGKDFYDLLVDPASGALHGQRIRTDAQTRFTRLGDWRMVDGVRMAFLVEEYRANGKLNATLRVRSIATNQRFADSLFTRPESERTLAFATGTHTTGPIRYNPFTGTRIYIPAKVNGRDVEVLLDSGADSSVLDKTFAESIGRKMVGSGTATGSGGEQQSGYVNDIDIAIANMTLHLRTATVIDLSDVSHRIAIPLQVILGKDVFLQSIVDVDPAGPTIAFHDPATFVPPRGTTLVPLEPLGSLRSVPVSVEGLPDAPMIFDLGNGGYMSLTPAYWQGHHLLDGRRHSARLSGAVGGEQVNTLSTLSTIRFAGQTFHHVPVELDAPNVELDSDREAGNVGMPLLKRFRMMIDFPNNRMFVVPIAERLAAPLDRDRAGLNVIQQGHALVVKYVGAGSPAAAAGWKKGETIVSIDGRPIDEKFASSDLSLWARQPEGTRVRLKMADGSMRTLTLADYF